MIELIEGFPSNVVAAVATGHVSRQDYDTVLISRVKAAAKEHAKIRCYYELGADFAGMAPGAAWEDFVLGMEFLTRWERVATVTDVPWIAFAVNALRFLMPAEMRVFPLSGKEAARAWIAAA